MYNFVSTFKATNDGGYEQRFLHLKFQLRVNSDSTTNNNTQQRNSTALIKELGMNRLEMSQYLQNGPLGKVNSTNLRVLKCPGNPDAQVSLSISILEQVEI